MRSISCWRAFWGSYAHNVAVWLEMQCRTCNWQWFKLMYAKFLKGYLLVCSDAGALQLANTFCCFYALIYPYPCPCLETYFDVTGDAGPNQVLHTCPESLFSCSLDDNARGHEFTFRATLTECSCSRGHLATTRVPGQLVPG